MAAPLEGINVVDMGWLMVGPESARYLTDLGATTVKVESGLRMDPLRSLGPFKDGLTGPNRSLSYHAINAGKRSIALDLKHPKARDVLLRLVRWADVLIESFAAGVIDRLGFSYETLHRENPSLIMVSTSLLGRKGPESEGTSGTGTTGSAWAGATNLLGWPDRMPTGPYGPWTDSVSPRFIVPSVLAALHRRRSGEGCYIDAAQAEAGIQFVLPLFYDYAVGARIAQRRGMAGSPLRCPAGVYPCAGEDRWVAIDASDHERWQALRRIVGGTLSDARFDHLLSRLRARCEIDREIAQWTSIREPQAVEVALQAEEIAAHTVSTSADLATDVDLHGQGYFRKIHDLKIGEGVTRAPTFTLERTPHVAVRAGPQLGSSTRDILSSICGYSTADIDALESAGVTR